MGLQLLDSPLSSALEVEWIREQYPELTALPRWATRRNPARETMGPELRATALDLGWDFMPWQRLVADVAGELDPDGSPHYQIVVCTIHRQGGKTTIILAIESHRCLVWARPQRVVYAAQTRGSAREKLIEDQIPMLQASMLGDLGRARLSNGHEAWRWDNGSRIGLQSNTKKSGHGPTNDLVVLDEAFAQIDWRHEQSLMPTMATKQDWQWWTFSTAGDESSLYLLDKVRRGRHLVETGRESRIAYFEWSIPMDADIDDPATWLRYLPAVGLTIRVEELQTFRANMPDAEFRRAFGNQWVDSADERPRVIPAGPWGAMAQPAARRDPDGFGRLAVDAAPDGSTTSIGIAVRDGATGKVHVEAIETRPGLAWAPGRVAEILGRPGREQFENTVTLSLATCGSLVPELEKAGVRVNALPGPEWNAACSSFLTGVHESAYVHIGDPVLDAAVDSADQTFSGDSWHWKRRGAESISPLCAVTLAAWALTKAADDYDLLSSFY
jgi:hypothetical protein